LRSVSARRVVIRFSEETSPPDGLPGGIHIETTDPHAWTLTAAGPLGPLFARLAGRPVYDIEITEPRLEDVVMRYYQEGQ
jgi:hypothetical protein